MRSALLAIVLLATTASRADELPPDPDPAVMARIRDLYTKRDYNGVRSELLAEYERTKHPSLLFALGQVELALENCQAAIDRYEQFIATNPAEEQIALAQQAIGAARVCTKKPPPPVEPPKPVPRRREWYTSDTVLVAAGGIAVGAAAGLFFYGRHLGNDHSGTLAAYDDRADRARTLQWSAAGLGAAGVITAAVAIVRWRLRPDDGVEIRATSSGAQVFVRW